MELPPEAYEEFRFILQKYGVVLSESELRKEAEAWLRLYNIVVYPDRGSHD